VQSLITVAAESLYCIKIGLDSSFYVWNYNHYVIQEQACARIQLNYTKQNPFMLFLKKISPNFFIRILVYILAQY